jgi:hypothetical protein
LIRRARRSPSRLRGIHATRSGASSGSPGPESAASSFASETRRVRRREGGMSSASQSIARAPSGRLRSIHASRIRRSNALEA